MPKRIPRWMLVLGLVASAIGIGFAVGLAVAALGHQVLVLTVGEDGIPAVDDTPLMASLVAASYLAWVLTSGVILALGAHRLRRRRG